MSISFTQTSLIQQWKRGRKIQISVGVWSSGERITELMLVKQLCSMQGNFIEEMRLEWDFE